MTPLEFWKEQYDTVVAEKKQLGEKLRETLSENKDLQEQLDRLKNSLSYTYLKNKDMENGRLKEENDALHNLVDSFIDKCNGLEAKAEGYKKELEEKIELLNAVQDRFTKADLKAQLEDLTQRYENTRLSLRIVNERLDKANADRSELQADRDIWFRKNGEKQAEIEELKKKIQSLEDDLKSKVCSRDIWRTEAERLRKELTESYSNGYSDGNEEGQNELWEMLQLVKDIQPNEFDTECECLGDVIDMDLEDFKEAYGKWEAKKQDVEYMRSYLKKYCIGKLCFGCPLYNTSEPVSSCLFSKLTDEEIEKKYRKVVNSEREKTPTPISSRLPQPWECTFEGTIEINEDILKVVCGIKDDKK